MWSFFLPTPLPSLISMVIARETTSLEARSLADGAYLSCTDTEVSVSESIAMIRNVNIP